MSQPDNGRHEREDFEVAIIGSGLGGTILAIGLIQQGVKVKMYEAAKAFGEIGAGVSSSPNALTALSLISPDLITAYLKHETGNMSAQYTDSHMLLRYGVNFQSKDGVRKEAGDLAGLVAAKANLPSHIKARSSVHRAKFLGEIVKLIPDGTVNFGKSLTCLTEQSDSEGNRVRMDFADGSSAEADAVIGCDGIKSVTRSFLYDLDVQPAFTRTCAYRALVPAKEFEEAMGHDQTYNGNLYVDKDRFILNYPVEHGAVINIIAIKVATESVWTHEDWQVPCDQDSVLSEYSGFHPKLVQLMAKYGARDKWGLHDLSHDKPYYRGRICLLGDSCHATTPHLGAGAGMAMEDSYVLSNLLGRVRHRAELEKAFQAYDAVRRPRSQQVIAASRESGESLMLRHPDAFCDPDRVKMVQDRLLSTVWDLDVEQHLQQAVDLMT